MSACRIFQGGKAGNGYGYIYHEGKMVYAHRLAYKLHYGEIPKGKYILHSCDNPACVNPDHLFAGTQKDNVQDMMKKGRNGFGNKLTIVDVQQIKRLLILGRNPISISRMYSVNKATIYKIAKGETWRNVNAAI